MSAAVGQEQKAGELHRDKSIKFLCVAVGFVSFALVLQIALNANFAVQEMAMSGFQQGLLEMFRETCGISALFILAMFAGLAEPLIAAAMVAVFAIGLGSYAFVHSYTWLVLASLVWSQGLHVWMPLPNSMGLALAERGHEGRRLGQIQAFGAAGSGAGLLAAIALSYLGVPIRPLYIVAGVAGLLGAAACLYIPRAIKTEKPKIVIRKEYRLYYLLSFLEGWRKQICLAFAGFLLVKIYGTSLSTMLWLWVATQAVGWFSSPAVGRLIDRVGERKVLIFYYACMVLFFVGYAFIRNKYLLYAVFLLDSSFFVFVMALSTYVGRLAPAHEKTMTLSMGVAIHHVAAVMMPLVGGLAWKYLGYQWTFIIGAFAAAVSVLAVVRVPMHRSYAPVTTEKVAAGVLQDVKIV